MDDCNIAMVVLGLLTIPRWLTPTNQSGYKKASPMRLPMKMFCLDITS